jgi:hypothetical protein
MTSELEKVREAIEQELLANGWIIDSNSANRICAAIEAAGAKVVFPEPTEEHNVTFWQWWNQDRGLCKWRDLYSAWFDAAPSLTAQKEEQGAA